MKKNLIKIIIEILCLCVALLVITFGSIAYFTDTATAEATMTAGTVKIALSEAALKADATGNLVADPEAPRVTSLETTVLQDYGTIYPAQTICKDPTITNIGNTDAWIAAKVTLTNGTGDLSNLIGYPGFHAIDIEGILAGGLLAEDVLVGDWNGFENVCHNDRYAMVQVVDPTSNAFEFYFFMLQKQQPGSEVVLFDTLFLAPEWDNTALQEIAGLKITVQAFGVQTFGFDSCYAAMTGAFTEYFPQSQQ